MNTALIFYGQPRFAKECAPLIKERLIGPNDADVFMHFWLPQEGHEYKYSSQEYDTNWKNLHIDEDIESWLVDFYKPKSYLAEKPKDFYLPVEFGDSIEKYFGGVKHLSEKEIERWKRIHIRNSLSRWYSIHKAYQLFNKFQIENDITYERIILTRFDCYPSYNINCKDWSFDRIYYEQLNQPDGMISDWILIGDQYLMKYIVDIYDYWNQYVDCCLSKYNAWCNELLQKESLSRRKSGHIKPISMGIILKRM